MSMQGLNTGYTGVIAAQTGIDVAGNNVANVGTDGYTRQRAEFRTRNPRLTQQGFIGTGVDTYNVTRARDAFLDARVRTGQTTLGAMVSNSGLMKRAEAVLGEPNYGISNELDDMFAAFEEVALNPSDNAAKVATITAMQSVAARVRGVALGFKKLQTDTAENLSSEIGEVNASLEEVARLNVAITEAATSTQQPNDLLDARDVVLDTLARKIGSRVIDNGDGTVRVSLNGLALVDGSNVRPISLNSTTFDLTHPNGVSLTAGGETGGVQTFLTQDIPNLLSTLNSFASDLSTAFNVQHGAGFYDATNNGTDLFAVTAGTEAETLNVVMTDSTQIAAASTGGTPFQAFNGENAQAMSDLRLSLTALGGTDTLGGSLRSFITEIGARTAGLGRSAEAQGELVAAAELARDGSQGVSLDEEMVNLVQFQRAYQAAARVMTTVDQALDTLINRTGLVGR